MHNGKAVREITLPTINRNQFDDTNGSFAREANARVVYDEFGGLSGADVSNSSVTGQFVGGSDGTSPGAAVMGIWEVGDLLDGSFGAEHVGTNAVTLPSSISQVNYGSADSGFSDSLKTLRIAIEGFSHDYTLAGLTSSTQSFTNPSRTATLRLRNTSLTRFGAWKLVTTSEGSSTLSGSGTFSYSQLVPTDYGGDSANFRPIRGIAQYAGRTVAVDSDGDLYDGTYRLNVTWGSSSSISAAISGLSGFTLGGVAVTQIGFQGSVLSGQEQRFLQPTTATVQYTTTSQGVDLPSNTTRDAFEGQLSWAPAALPDLTPWSGLGG